MLTPEQREIRKTGVGASEIGAVSLLHPYRGPLDVWLRKPTASRAPMVEEDDEDELDLQAPAAIRRRLGEVLEDGLRDVYAELTGLRVAKVGRTLRHPELSYVLASPDGEATPKGATAPDRGVEIKVVGQRVAHQWGDDPPDHVVAQAAQCMAVTGLPRWDVVALVGGTELRVHRVDRDPEYEAALLEAAEVFWIDYVEGDVQPEPRDEEERYAYLLRRYPYPSDRSRCAVVGEGRMGEIAEAASWLATATRLRKTLEAAEGTIEHAFCELVRDRYGVEGPWGKFLWYPIPGKVSWKDVAEELGGGAVPPELIEKHRGKPSRVPKLYPYKPKELRRR